MKNKRFLGQFLAVMLSVSMAAGVCAAEFGDGNSSSSFTDTAQETEKLDEAGEGTVTPASGATGTSTPGVTETPTPGVTETPTPGATETPTPGEAGTPTPGATGTPTPEVTVTPGPTVTPNVTVTPSISPSPSVTPVPSDDYEYTKLEDGTVSITAYKGDDSEIEIPAEIDGWKVSQVGNAAFKDQKGLASVVIPNGVTGIGDAAFSGCEGLKTVSIPDSVVKIGTGAFAGCGLLTVEISAGNSAYSVQNGVLFSRDMKTLFECIGDKTDYTVPESVTKIAAQAFANVSVNCVKIINAACMIEEAAEGQKMTIPESVKIYGYPESDAETYAKKHGNMFEALSVTPTPSPEATGTPTPSPEITETPTPTPVPVKITATTIKLSQTTCNYTGKPVVPGVKIQYNGTTLKAGTDYSISYLNNTKIGTATVTIKGLGKYTGTVKKNFKIVLGAPTVKSASSAGYNAAKITWNKVAGARSYTLYYKAGTGKSWKAVASNLTKTSYTHTSSTKYPLTAGTKYTYTVKAVNGKNASTYGTSTKTVTPVPATVKLGKVTSAAYNKQKITWNKVAGATGYIVYQKINGAWKKLAATKELSYINTNSKEHPVVTGVTNTYTVKAYRKVGKKNIYGGYSKTGISGKALLAKPSVSKITKTSKGLKLQWKKITGAVGYVVQRYDSGKWVTKKTINSSKTLTYTDTTAKKGKTYKYRIAAFCKANGKPFYSVYSAVKTGKR